jgi:hypothetical protein
VNLDPRILLKLGSVRTRNEAAQVWIDHWDELEGWLFVLSEKDETDRHLRWPARLDLQGKGFLRSAFAHDSIWFTNSEILGELSQERRVDIPVDYSIGFDSNAATYLLALTEGRKPDIVRVFQEVLRNLAGARFNWDALPYLHERFEDLVAGRDYDSIWRTVLATERFAACDQERFAATGEMILPTGEEEAITRARDLLAMYHDELTDWRAETLRRQHGVTLAIVFKVVALERQHPGARNAALKLAGIIEFMHSRLHCLFFLLIWAAGEYFRLGSGFRPLRKLRQDSSAGVGKAAANVAWDFMHVLSRQSMSCRMGREGSFHVPYFLTFDRDIAALYDGFPQRSCLLGPNDEGPHFTAETPLDTYLFGHWPELNAEIDWVFLEHVRAERNKAHRDTPADVPALLAELRQELGLPGT